MDLNDYVTSDFNGAISARQHGQVVCQQAFGMADVANQRHNKLDTCFAIASGGKVFTAVGILQLIETGQLTIDTSIGQLFDFDMHQIDPDVTVRQLLTHTSGVPDYFDESRMSDYAKLWADIPNYRIRHSADLLPLFIEKPMLFETGERFQYSNSGYVLLAMIIEKITGLPFDQYIQQSVFQPAGMDHSGYFELDRLPGNCANGYVREAEHRVYSNVFSVDAKGTGAGGVFTSVFDIDRFWDALLHYKLLKPYVTGQMLGLQAKGEQSNYGYGVWLRALPDDGRYAPYIQGQDPGVSFVSEFDPVHELLITVVSNSGDDVWAIRERLFTNLTKE